MLVNKNIFQRAYRFFAILIILGFAWAGFLWLTQAPPIDAIPSLLMVWATAIILLLAFFPSVLSNVGRLKVGDVEFELRDSVKSANTQNFVSVSDLSSAYQMTSQGDAGGLQTILARALESPGKPVLLVIDLQEQKITRAFLFAFLMLMDLLSELVIVAFAAPRITATEPGKLNIADIVGLISGKKLLHAYHRRFPSLMNIFIREKGITSVLEPSGFIQTPSSELILGLYDQCRVQISQDIQNEKGRYTELEHPEMDERLSRHEIEKWLKELLNRRVVDGSLQTGDIATIHQALEEKEDFVLVAANGGFQSALVLDDFSRVIAHNALGSLAGNS
ncbi:MAG: hypothetical protein HZB50_00275 [Chloroflexi bacterium]|nr:hypothetical protein [Chloroflexota bacterium]